MHSIEIAETCTKAEIPSSWGELSNKQFDYVLKKALDVEANHITMLDFRIHIVFYFLEIKYSPISRVKDRFLTDNQLEEKYRNILELSKLVDFIFVEKLDKKTKKKSLEFDFTSVKNFIPALIIKKKIFYGPADAITNISFAEYRQACTHYLAFAENKTEDELNKLVSCLYRPERENFKNASKQVDFDGHRREKFNPHIVLQRVAIFKKVPFHQRFAIYLWFKNCLNFLNQGTITVEGNDICLEILYNKSADSKPDGLGNAGTLFRMADEGTFGSIRETDETGLYDILLKLYQMKKDYDEFKRKNKINDSD